MTAFQRGLAVDAEELSSVTLVSLTFVSIQGHRAQESYMCWNNHFCMVR